MIVSKEPKRRGEIDLKTLKGRLSIISGLIWQKFELMQAFMGVLFTCKSEKDRIKNNRKKIETPSLHYRFMGLF